MSYYGFYDARVEHMICDNCTTEAFAWIAEIFPCPMCGRDKYIYPGGAEEGLPANERNKSVHAGRIDVGTEEIVKKRKRSVTGGGRRKYGR
jgi:hypothetical protein